MGRQSTGAIREIRSVFTNYKVDKKMRKKLIGFHTGYSSTEPLLICTKMETETNSKRIQSEYGILSFRKYKLDCCLKQWVFFNTDKCGIKTPQVK